VTPKAQITINTGNFLSILEIFMISPFPFLLQIVLLVSGYQSTKHAKNITLIIGELERAHVIANHQNLPTLRNFVTYVVSGTIVRGYGHFAAHRENTLHICCMVEDSWHFVRPNRVRYGAKKMERFRSSGTLERSLRSEKM
jgi:hypothetical protein